jgi:hypothetical protein
MAYNQELAVRVRQLLQGQPGLEERKMFGGLTFMVMGHMCCGVHEEDLMVRIGSDGYEDALAEPGARLMDFTGRPLRGFLFIGPEGYGTAEGMRRWLDRAASFALSQPPGGFRAPRKARRQP